MNETEQNDDAPKEPEVHGAACHLLQITEEDFADLERLVPAICERCMQMLDDNKSRVRLRRLKEILSNVRWNYGPWGNVTVIPAEGSS